MTHNEVLKLACDAGFVLGINPTDEGEKRRLERFAALVLAQLVPWTRVSEQLPQDLQSVIVTTAWGGVRAGFYATEAGFRYARHDGDPETQDASADVTHWMPLPDAPATCVTQVQGKDLPPMPPADALDGDGFPLYRPETLVQLMREAQGMVRQPGMVSVPQHEADDYRLIVRVLGWDEDGGIASEVQQLQSEVMSLRAALEKPRDSLLSDGAIRARGDNA